MDGEGIVREGPRAGKREGRMRGEREAEDGRRKKGQGRGVIERRVEGEGLREG